MKQKKPFAVFTICKDEKTFLPLWVKYYSRFLRMENLYVIDHLSQDGSTDNLPCNTILWDYELAFDHQKVVDKVREVQQQLLELYEIVLFTEIDEIVFHKDGLFHYATTVALRDRDFVRCNGYDIIHMVDEADFDPSRPILDQRRYWFRNHTFQAKPLLSRISLDWTYGFHSCHQGGEIDPNLYMIHLNRFDYKMAYERNLDRQKMNIHQGDKAAGYGFQKHLQGEAFRDWFYNFRFDAPVEVIPDWVPGAVRL